MNKHISINLLGRKINLFQNLRYAVLIGIPFLLFSCTQESQLSTSQKLANNTNWPIQIIGSLELIDLGGIEDNYASWAVGLITPIGETEEITLDLGDGILESAGLDIHFSYSKSIAVWVMPPKYQFGSLIYPVVKINEIEQNEQFD